MMSLAKLLSPLKLLYWERTPTEILDQLNICAHNTAIGLDGCKQLDEVISVVTLCKIYHGCLLSSGNNCSLINFGEEPECVYVY